MAKRQRAKDRVASADQQPATANAFAGLAGLRDQLPPGEPPLSPQPVAETAPSPFAAKLVLRRQRKGHGGKTVTVLSGVLFSGDERADFMRRMGKALGTHVREDGDDILLAGDQTERAADWLRAQGARRIATGG